MPRVVTSAVFAKAERLYDAVQAAVRERTAGRIVNVTAGKTGGARGPYPFIGYDPPLASVVTGGVNLSQE